MAIGLGAGMHGLRGAWVSLLACCLAVGPARSQESAEPQARHVAIVTHVGGERFSASVARIEQDGTLVWQVADKQRKMSSADLVAWGAPAELEKGALLILANGSLLAANLLESDGEQLQFDSDALGTRSLAWEEVAAVLTHVPADPRQCDQWIARLKLRARRAGDDSRDAGATHRAGQPETEANEPGENAASSDLLFLANGDELPCTVLGCKPTAMIVDPGGGPVEIALEKLDAVAMNPDLLARHEPPAESWLVGFQDGSLLVTEALTLLAHQVEVRVGARASWTAEAEQLVFLQHQGGKVTYLSDLRAESYRHIPYLSLAWPYRLDANVLGTRARAGGRLYAKAIGMHSAARLTYKLNKSWSRFEADLAIDDSTRGSGSVTVRILVDSQPKFKSELVRGSDPVLPISVDIRGAKRLSLLVEFGEFADELDHVDWLDARLVE